MAPSTKPPKSSAKDAKSPRSKWRRRALYAAGGAVAAVPVLWFAIHNIPGVGPALADGARALFGPGVVAWAEDVSYGIQDRVNRLRYKDAKPTTFWDTPSAAKAPATAAAIAPAAASSAAPAAAAPKDFPPAKFDAPYPSVATDVDGTWVPIEDGLGAGPVMFKSLVHPDPKRSFAAVAVVAVDLRRVSLHLVAGTQEPENPKIPAERRPGLVPKDAQGDLVAAFNGGFKAIHGHWGMMLDGDQYVAPRDIACTVGLYKDGSIKIHTWRDLKDEQG
ncbi:MAG TPA: hypothetical protein VHB21_11935, partial [Minicystis sp.]|nr:hypothetical protein [Minicystis sp.]